MPNNNENINPEDEREEYPEDEMVEEEGAGEGGGEGDGDWNEPDRPRMYGGVGVASKPRGPSKMERIEQMAKLLAPSPAPLNATPPMEEAHKEETVDEFVNLSKEDDEFLFGTEDPQIEGDEELDVMGMSEKEEEYLFGTGLDEGTDRMPKRKPKVTYTVRGKGKKRKRTRAEQDRDTDEFLFGTKGAF